MAAAAQPAGPCTLVIFGAKGDLTRRKLMPALVNLAREELLSEQLSVVGVGRGGLDTTAFRAMMSESIAEYAKGDGADELWSRLESRLSFVDGSFDDPDSFAALRSHLDQLEREQGTGGNILFYLATAPSYFAPIVRMLDSVGLARPEGGRWRRVVIEKPFGRDLESARDLNRALAEILNEDQIYRIDHYLGKETVQNLLVFRFANGIFEPIWNRRYVDHVQITVAETLGVGSRGGYYDGAGALRDMVPNHVFQLISLIAMEPPISFDADAVRDEQSKVLRAIKTMTPEEVLHCTVRGQYGAGTAGGKALPDYRAEDRVASNSATESFVAAKLYLDNWRWKDVPFYLRVGKALEQRVTEISVHFKRPPFLLFRETKVDALSRNVLVVNVQPQEGITLTFGAKVPGATMEIATVDMDFRYREHFDSVPATGYERLLYEAMLGDQTLFQRADMVEAGWRVVNPILDVWAALPPRDFPNYDAGSWGPKSADALLEDDGHHWRARTA